MGSETGSGKDLGETSEGVNSEAMSRKPSKVEPGTASKPNVQVAKLPKVLKPARIGKKSANAPKRPAGGQERPQARGSAPERPAPPSSD